MDETLRITRHDFNRSGLAEGISTKQLDELWEQLVTTAPPGRSGIRNGQNVAFYLGGFVALTAMSVFMGEGWASYGPGFGLLFAVLYACGFAIASATTRRRGWPVPGGILATIAVSLVPLIVFAFQQTFGLWSDKKFQEYHDFYPYVSSSWFVMELATIVVGLVVLYRVRFGLVLLPIGVSMWFMSMDATQVIFGRHPSDTARIGMALAFGVGMIVGGRLFDRQQARDLGFWPHLFGLVSVTGALSFVAFEQGEVGWAVLSLTSLALIMLSVVWSRTTYAVFGGMGVYCWLAHLAFAVFRDSLGFPIAIAAMGLVIMRFGVTLSRRRDKWRATLLRGRGIETAGELAVPEHEESS